MALFAWHPWRSKTRTSIVLSGNIEMTQVDIAFKVPGKLIERNFDEGDTVPKGAVVARLDRESLLQQRDQAEAALAVAEAQLAQAKPEWLCSARLRKLKSSSESGSRRSAGAAAELKNGSRPQEISEAKAAVKSAEAENERTRKDWERAEVLHKSDDISTQQYDQARQQHDVGGGGTEPGQAAACACEQGPRHGGNRAGRVAGAAGSRGPSV